MKLRWGKILADPTFWVLLTVNIYLVYYYEQKPAIFTTLIWLYWSQSIIYGIFNYIDIRTTKNFYKSGFSNKTETESTEQKNGEAEAWFSSRLYAFFHFVYFIFLAGFITKTGAFEWNFYWKFLIVFFVFQVMNLIQRKIRNKNKAMDITKMATIPFVRVIPMHLCILIPAFLNISNLTVFLVLKVITDIIMYVHTTDYYKKNDPVPAFTGINIDSTISS